MNQLCKVCGEPAAGFHFGAFTCEGCKSFFGRTYNNISSISECKNNGECVINKKNRTSCKACRLRKCLLVGMSKSGSRYGRRSNWFKIHCLLQEQQQAGVNMAAAASLLRPHPYLSPLFRTSATCTTAPGRDASRSSESDSGASSADPEDDARSSTFGGYHRLKHEHQASSSPASDRDYLISTSASVKKLPSSASDSECFDRRKFISALVNAPSVSPASLPSISPSTVVPKWLPPLHGVADPSAWRDLWTTNNNNIGCGSRAALPTIAAPAPDQLEPIDLSVKPPPPAQMMTAASATPPPSDNDDPEMCIDVGVDEPIKSVPLDLTLDRQTTDVTN